MCQEPNAFLESARKMGNLFCGFFPRRSYLNSRSHDRFQAVQEALHRGHPWHHSAPFNSNVQRNKRGPMLKRGLAASVRRES